MPAENTTLRQMSLDDPFAGLAVETPAMPATPKTLFGTFPEGQPLAGSIQPAEPAFDPPAEKGAEEQEDAPEIDPEIDSEVQAFAEAHQAELDRAAAEKLLAWVGHCERRIAENEEQLKVEIGDARARFAEKTEALKADCERFCRDDKATLEYLNNRFGEALAAYVAANKKPSARSITLYNGRAGWRSTGGGWEVTDPMAALRWALETMPAVVTSPEKAYHTTKFKAALSAFIEGYAAENDGEVPDLPFVEKTEAVETFYMTGKKSK